MKLLRWETLQKLRELFEETAPPPDQMAFRLRTVERDIILPVKAVFIVILAYSLYFSRWFDEVALPRSVAQAIVERFFVIYLIFNVGVAGILIFYRKFDPLFVQRLIFNSNFVDAVFLAALTFVTGGFDSILYWLFLGLIVRNAVSSPLAAQQIILNIAVSFCYLSAGVADVAITDEMLDYEEMTGWTPNPTEPLLLRLILLWLMGACCYGVQVLFEKQRQAAEEAQEFVARQEQLRAAGRLAARIAHQIKNPLGIINNAAYSLQRALTEGKGSPAEHLSIIREEVDRSDQIVTKLMGYAQLAEGKVEKLEIREELDRAINQVFPPGSGYETVVHKDYSPGLSAIMMQRSHLSETLVNLLLNAREATEGKGRVDVSVRPGEENCLIITVSDDGPGIAEEHVARVFEPYYTTKKHGTGLGLAIVKQNAEIYNGTVHVESELGKGARFVLQLPTRTFMRVRK